MTHRMGLVLAAAALLAACGAAPPSTLPEQTAGDDNVVVFTPRVISAESAGCADDQARCARVEVTTLATAGGGTDGVRDNVDLYLLHDLVSRLRSLVPEEVGNRTTDPEELVAAFLGEHRLFVTDFPDATAMWSVEILTEAVYNTPAVVTISVSEIAYTGGAHPNSRRRVVSFDVGTGQLLGIDDLTADPAALIDLAERQLRNDHGLAADDDLAAAGFWFADGEVSLPDNIGVVADGLLIHWDPYVIAPYSMGPIEVVIPSAELEEIIDRPYWPTAAPI